MGENPPPKPLPDDILIEIFSRLPVKTLLLIRCISKSWHTIIAHNDDFSIKKLPSLMCGLFNKDNESKIQFTSLRSRTYIDTTLIDTSLTFMASTSRRCNFDIVDCCNGLLLLRDSSYCLYICNPATRRWAQISEPPGTSVRLVLAFDRRRSIHYRVFSFSEGGAYVYSSETREWREIPGFQVLSGIYLQYSCFIFLNEILYALKTNDRGRTKYGCTLAVDVDGKVLRRIQLLELDLSFGACGYCLGHSGGQLHYALNVDGELLIWFLEDSASNKYVLKHRTSIRAIVDKLPGSEALPEYVGMLGFHPDLDVIFLKLLNKLFSYHLVSAKIEDICKFEWGQPCFAYAPCYSEELDLHTSLQVTDENN